MADAEPVILEERRGNVLLLTINRPERHNALSAAVTHFLGEAIARAAGADVRAIVLTGAGEKAFCAGGDMLEMSGVEAGQTPLPPPDQRRHAFTELATTPVPVIAAVNGYCYGGGALLAIACDLRLASKTATFRLPGVEYGLVVGAATLPRLVGAARAKEWILTARKFDAEEAHTAGMVNSLHEPEALLDAAMDMATTIAGHSKGAVQASKRVIDAATLSEDAQNIEAEANRELRGSPEQTERFRNATRRVTGR